MHIICIFDLLDLTIYHPAVELVSLDLVGAYCFSMAIDKLLTAD